MKNSFLSLAMLLMFAFSCAQQTSNRATKSIHISDFNAVDVSSMFNVEINQSNTYKIEIDVSPAKYLDQVVVEKKGNTLYIKTEGNLRNIKHLKASISMPTLEKVVQNGLSKVKLNDVFSSENLYLEIGNLSKFKGEVTANKMTEITTNSQSNVTLMVNSGLLVVKADSQSSVNVSGKAHIVELESSSMSNISAQGLEYDSGTAKASSMSKINIDTSKLTRAVADEMSKIR